MTKVIKPLTRVDDKLKVTIFLAGSIEMGSAEDWQIKVEKLLDGKIDIIYNPRRDDWDSSWKQEIGNKQFNDQVTWEMDHIDKASFVLFYFAPGTKSPITLMELGYCAGKFPDKCIVVCPDGFWRKGNVDIICYRNKILQYQTVKEAVESITK